MKTKSLFVVVLSVFAFVPTLAHAQELPVPYPHIEMGTVGAEKIGSDVGMLIGVQFHGLDEKYTDDGSNTPYQLFWVSGQALIERQADGLSTPVFDLTVAPVFIPATERGDIAILPITYRRDMNLGINRALSVYVFRASEGGSLPIQYTKKFLNAFLDVTFNMLGEETVWREIEGKEIESDGLQFWKVGGATGLETNPKKAFSVRFSLKGSTDTIVLSSEADSRSQNLEEELSIRLRTSVLDLMAYASYYKEWVHTDWIENYGYWNEQDYSNTGSYGAFRIGVKIQRRR